MIVHPNLRSKKLSNAIHALTQSTSKYRIKQNTYITNLSKSWTSNQVPSCLSTSNSPQTAPFPSKSPAPPASNPFQSPGPLASSRRRPVLLQELLVQTQLAFAHGLLALRREQKIHRSDTGRPGEEEEEERRTNGDPTNERWPVAQNPHESSIMKSSQFF